MQRLLVLVALAVLVSGSPLLPGTAPLTRVGPEAQDRADAAASPEASAEPSSSFFDTFMAFLGSSTLGQGQSDAGADGGQEQDRALGGDLAAAGSVAGPPPQDVSPEQGRSLGSSDRVKRTGQLLHTALNHKLGYISKGSHHIHFHNYNKCDKPHFGLWEFKKAILSKLLEAAKAIGGGVLALKGKLITAKGHLVAAKGRKIAHKGEELTEFGKGLLAKALAGHSSSHSAHHPDGEEVHTAPSAPEAGPHYPTGAGAAYGVQPGYGYGGYANYGYPAQGYPAAAPSGHGYNAAVSLLNEYSRAGFGVVPRAPIPAPAHAHAHAPVHAHAHAPAPHAHAHAHGSVHRTGLAPTGPSATGPAGTLPGNLQAGLLVLQPAPSASQRTANFVSAGTYHHFATAPAPAPAPAGTAGQDSSPASAPASDSTSASSALFVSQDPSPQAVQSQPLVLAPELVEAMMGTDSNKVRRYAMQPSSRRSLDLAMAAVVRGLHGGQHRDLQGSTGLRGSDLLLSPEIVRSAATSLLK